MADKRSDETPQDWKVYLNGLPAAELASLLSGYAAEYPEIRRDLERRASLATGKVGDVIRLARKQMKTTLAERGFGGRWGEDGDVVDYGPLTDLLERLLALGAADSVVELGKQIAEEGFTQVGESDDEGETGSELAGCLRVVFRALEQSSLADAQKLLYVIDVMVGDDYDLCGDPATELLEAEWPAEAWSAAADELAARLAKADRSGSFSDKYHRQTLAGWLVTALENAGRAAEVIPLLESEAPITESYESLVRALIDAGRLDDARRWIVEGIEKTAAASPGIANQLRAQWQKLALASGDVQTVAAMRAEDFFHDPALRTLDALREAARKAGCADAVEAAALRFLETGERPTAATAGESKQTPATAWPLPEPPAHLKQATDSHYGQPVGPRFDVLLTLALAEKKPDEILRWYDRMKKERSAGGYSPFGDGTIADAIAEAHPERAVQIYRGLTDEAVARSSPSASESALPYFRKLRELLVKLGREAEWKRYDAELRAKYKRRTTLIAVLDRVVTKRISDT